jgi:hypothetical protein
MAITLYAVIGDPPSVAGGAHDAVTKPSPTLTVPAETAVGAAGTTAAVPAAEGVTDTGLEGTPLPTASTAATEMA